MKITINQTVTKSEQVEKQISIPSYRKEKGSYPAYVAILGENECIKVFTMAGGGYTSLAVDQNAGVVCYFIESQYEECTYEEFAEAFKKGIEDFGQAAAKFATDFIVRVDSLPTEEEITT